MMPPKVSVILPNYNYARFLDERIRSILDQTFTDFELIIVDDASTDASRAVIEPYRSDSRVRTLWFDSNSGSTYGRWNDGAQLATGDYLFFAGADDACAPTFLERLVSTLDHHPDVGVVYSRSWMIDGVGSRILLKPKGERWTRDFVADSDEEIPWLLDSGGVLTASAALLRRSVFQRCGGWDATLQLHADRKLWAGVLATCRLAYVAEPLCYFRSHGQNVGATTRADRALLEEYAVVEFILKSFDLPADVQEETLDRLARRWIELLLHRRDVLDARTALAIYRQARKTDRAFNRRLTQMAITATKRRLGR